MNHAVSRFSHNTFKLLVLTTRGDAVAQELDPIFKDREPGLLSGDGEFQRPFYKALDLRHHANGFVLRADDANQEVVGVSHIVQPLEPRVVHVETRHRP